MYEWCVNQTAPLAARPLQLSAVLVHVQSYYPPHETNVEHSRNRLSAQVDNAPLLLEALAPLSCLRHLDLRGIYRAVPGRVAEPATLSFALAVKPHLSYLDLGQNRIYELAESVGLVPSFGTAFMGSQYERRWPPWQLPALQVRLTC
jgi:hypothetical protein